MKAKKIITMIAMLLTTIGAMAGTDKFTLTDVTYPYVQQSNTNYCKVASVTYGSTITMVKLVYNTAKITFQDTKNIVLVDPANDRTYNLKFIKGHAEKEKMEIDGQRFVTLVFPKLKKNPNTVSLIENDGNGLMFEGIDLTQSGPMQSVFDKDALENELNKNYGNGMNFQQIGE